MAECPTCGRWLVTFYRDGSFDIAPKVGVSFVVSPSGAREEETIEMHAKPETAVATCYRWRCRLRRYRARQGGLFRLGVSRHG